MAGAGVAGKQVASVAVERVGGAAGQRYFDVRTRDGRLDWIAEGRLEWVWRLVFTSVGIGRSMSMQLTSPRLRVIGTLVFLLLVAGGFYLVFKLGYNK